ncbi:MAG: hypothetical protein ISS57_07800 [Anaerolineales bacterium]|nr:hypothetical protein [Anaerolineales bacterium]
MVIKEKVISPALNRYRLATALIWVGVLAWVPFITLRTVGQKPSLFWFLPFHLIGVVGGSRLRAAARREIGIAPQKKRSLRTTGHILVFVGILVWVPHFYLKLVAHMLVEVSQFLPYHLTAVLSGVALLLVNFLVNRRKS